MVRACLVAGAALGLASTPLSSQAPPPVARFTAHVSPAPQALADRVTAFFTAWKERDLGAMYQFYCTPYREKTPRTEYLKLTRLFRFPIIEFEVRGVDPAAATTTVVIRLRNDTAPMPLGIVDSETRQVWLREGGTWCRESEELLLPFPGAR